MTEYKIYIKSKLKYIKRLWKEFFKNDSTWHFTLEGDYVEVRVAKPSKKLDKWLADQGWKFDKFEYQDNIPITRKYQQQFQKIFHGLSELSMLASRKGDWVNENSEVRQLVERCVHLTFNIMGYNLSDETRNMAALLIDRAGFEGYLRARQQIKVQVTKEPKGGTEKDETQTQNS